ncbi:MAG: dephospho-CoA kinase [Euryarchaeota archaeon]|nr:dephospho-CoA kinase [Euryarchaeota archaeon]|tara:strand:+ start:437 stop:1000 length:564 start_codon:yes stop_codon:yes gene_type:complete
MEAKVVAICGMPGSGKGELSRIANENGIPVLSMGDMIRAEAENRGLEETPGNIGLVVVSLRGQFGEQILAERLLPSIENLSLASVPIILIEGIRGTAEADVFKNHWGDNFSLLGLISDEEIRWQRILLRGRGEDGDREDFATRNTRERKWGLAELIENSEYKIENNSTLDDLEIEFKTWLEKLKSTI